MYDELTYADSVKEQKKHCTRCFIKKPLTEFHNHSQTTDGKQSHCKVCSNKAAVKARRKMTKKKGKAWWNAIIKAWRDKNRKKYNHYQNELRQAKKNKS